MNVRDEAAWELHQFLGDLGIDYAIIGGAAVQIWGEPRLTQDVDLTASIPLDEPAGSFIQEVLDRFPARLEDALGFARQNRVILIRASNGCPVDISMGLPGYEDQVMERAVEVELEPGKAVRFCSAEDLIVHKAIAGRPQDVRDVEGIVYRQGSSLDAGYIRHWLRVFADLLDNPSILMRFERPWQHIEHT